MSIGKVKQLVELLQKAPQDDILMLETECEKFLENREILLDVDDVLVGGGTLKGITFLKIIGLKQFETEIRSMAIDEFVKSLKTDYVNFDMLYILQDNNFLHGNASLRSYKNMIDELAKEMKGGEKDA